MRTMKIVQVASSLIAVAIVIATAGCAPAAEPLPQPIAEAEPDQYLEIVPGERIGQWSLDMTILQLQDTLGTPSDTDERGGRKTYHWKQYGVKAYYSIFANKVEMITLSTEKLRAQPFRIKSATMPSRIIRMRVSQETGMSWHLFENGLVWVLSKTETATVAIGVWSNTP